MPKITSEFAFEEHVEQVLLTKNGYVPAKQEGYDKAKKILTEKRGQLDTIANALLEFETLSGEEMKGLLQGKRPVREDTNASSPQPPRGSAVPTTGQKPEPDVGGLSPNPV